MTTVSFDRRPDEYRHWRLRVEPPLAWLEIELELDDEAGFFTMLERRLSTAC